MQKTDQTGGAGPIVHTNNNMEYRYFDVLPKILRDEIANAPYDYSVEQIHNDYIRWKKENWFFSPPDDEYLDIMRANFRGLMRDLTPAEVYNPVYKLQRRQKHVAGKSV